MAGMSFEFVRFTAASDTTGMAGGAPGPLDYPNGIDEAAALRHLDVEVASDLRHIFQECGVPLPLQYRLSINFRTVRRFASYADSRAEVRAALRTDHTLDATDQASRAVVASVVAAWEASKEYAGKEASLKAEARVLGVVRPVTQTEKQAMRAAFEAVHGSIEETYEPSEEYLSAKIEEVESGEVSASPLSEVISKKRAKTQGIQTSVDTTGHVRIVRQKAKGNLPAHTEELRTVLRVEANMWTFLASKYRNQAMFRGMTPAVWLDYVNYLLGDKVYLMQVPTPGGKGKGDQQPLRPPWQVLLTYEYEMRREAVKKAFRESRALVDTLAEVQGNAQLKEQFFVSPLRSRVAVSLLGNVPGNPVANLKQPGENPGTSGRKEIARATSRAAGRARRQSQARRARTARVVIL